jgi:ABC-type nickel/cobalt efflux system permease component RcnA
LVRSRSYYLPRIPDRSALSDISTLVAALVLGFLHALEIDHMLAVTTFVSRRPPLVTAAGFGLKWGLGHSLAVLALGGILLTTGIHWPERWTSFGEAAVGVLLVGLGLWSLRATRNLHLHPAAEHGDHLHLHSHADRRIGGSADERSDDHDHPGPHHHHHHHHHGRGVTLVGLAHGLAGTAAVVALVPVTMVGRTAVGVGYLVAFGIGVTVAMTLFALGAAIAIRKTDARSLGLGRTVSSGVGLAGVLLGIWWIVRAVST